MSSQNPSIITVRVQLHSILQRDYAVGNFNALEMQVQDGSTVYTILEQLNINLSLEHLLLVVNGRLVEPSYVLMKSDEVHIIPAISGGLL